tara:strand:- start:476 stop:3469 length:2994 start_codon:yes stop_codon:yes gene_type:complete
MIFQAITWDLQNKSPPPFKRDITCDKHVYEASTLVIHCCGRTASGESVRLAIIDYRPYFFARITEENFLEVVRNFKYKSFFGNKAQKKEFEEWWVFETRMVEKVIYQGFKNGEKDAVLQITCASQSCMRDLIKALTDTKMANGRSYELFDIRQDVLCDFYHATRLEPCGWIQMNGCLEIDDADPPFGYDVSVCDHDYVVRVGDLEAISKIEMAPFLTCSIDIEAFAPKGSDGRYPFPEPERADHKTSCICLRRRKLTEEQGDCVFFSYRALDLPRVQELCHQEKLNVDWDASKVCHSERDMFVAFLVYFSNAQFDIIIGWNTLNFDMNYIYKRCQLLGLEERIAAMGRWGSRAPRLQDVTLSTAGAGHNRFRFWNINGVFQMDELVVVRRDKKYDSYKLNNVAQIVLGDTKMDEPPDEIHRKSQGTPYELAEIVSYCMKDTFLPDQIACKLQSYMKNFMFANMATVPVTYLLTRGANIKTSSFIMKNVRERGYIISSKDRYFNKIDGKYEGATVLDALKGFYDDPVATLDFKSLYPSIFISQVLDPHAFVESEEYLGLPGVKYKTHQWVDGRSGQQFKYTIVTNGSELGCPAVIPEIMEGLWNQRDLAKKKMKNAATYTEKSVYDGIQLAVKLLMNSIYGFFGALNSSPVPHLPLAMICTYTGRKFIEESQKFVLCRYGTFGDSSALRDASTKERMTHSLEELTEAVNGTVVNVYGDTDSIFVKWQVSEEARAAGQTALLEENFRQSELAAAEITTWLLENHCPCQRRVEMEFEKVYWSLISYSKKRYIGLLWTKLDKPDYIDYKGVQPVRRDTPKILKTTIQECIDLILVQKDREAAFSRLQQTFERIACGNYEVREFCKTGAISDREYVGALPPAAEVAIHLRGRGLPVPDRVEYVYIIGDPKEKASKKVESPEYVMANDAVKVDVKYYMTNQFRKPVLELLGPALDGLEELIDTYTKRYAEQTLSEEQQHRRQAHQKEIQTAPITSFFSPRGGV